MRRRWPPNNLNCGRGVVALARRLLVEGGGCRRYLSGEIRMSTANKTVAFFSGVTQAPTKPHIRRDPQSDVWASGYYSRGLVVFCRTYISQADQLKLKMIRWLTLLDYTKRVRPVDMNELM